MNIESTRLLFKEIVNVLAPPPEITVSEWADQNRILSQESSSEPGRWDTDRTPYLKEIMDCILDPEVEEVTGMIGSQVGKTESQINMLGYFIDHDPCPILFVHPSDVMGTEFGKDRMTPFVRDNPVIDSKVYKSSTNARKGFLGGYVAIIGANSPSKLASRPIRIVLADEIDRYPLSAKQEGDPLALATKRTATFWNRKIIAMSTPTIKGLSRIESRYNNSSMGKWHVPCPSCGGFNIYDWKRLDFETCEMSCKECGALHGELEWKKGKGKWIHEKKSKKHIGFHLNEMASPFTPWEAMRDKFLEVKNDPEELKVFINTSLAETWEEKYDNKIDWGKFFKNRIQYEAEIPDEALLITAGVDVQDSWLEIEVVGWGKDKESWGIEHKIIRGNPEDQYTWDELDKFLIKDFKYKDGTPMKIACTCIDTGGHNTEESYNYISPIQNIRRVYGIKGLGKVGTPILNGFRRTKNKKIDLLSLGVNALKDTLMNRLELDSKSPGYCNFPIGRGYDENYFKGLTSEIKVVEKGKIKWKQIRARNEALDIRNYATAALEILKVDLEDFAKIELGKRVKYCRFKKKKES
ncbi:phage terminase large subunit family protein [Psychrilyobacter sp.]|uniref:phage terminase large subunit family protein n=1 Tax=Psychrilyobacter sp. TaxID=2586924 RepID=UPI0030175E57